MSFDEANLRGLVESCVKCFSPQEASAHLCRVGAKHFNSSWESSPDLWPAFRGRWAPDDESLVWRFANSKRGWRDVLAEDIQNCIDKVERMYSVYSYLIQLRLDMPMSKKQQANTLTRWFTYALRGQLEVVLKFKTAWLLATALNQDELPKRPACLDKDDNPAWLFQGKVGRRIKLYTKTFSSRSDCGDRVQFFYELYSAKRASKSVSPDFVDAALDKHWNTVTVLDQQDDKNPFLDMLCEEVVRTVKEVIPKRDLEPRYDVCPSFGASYDTARKDGGSFKELVGPYVLGLTPAEGYLLCYLHCRTNCVEFRCPDPDLDWLDYIQSARGRTDVFCRPIGLLEPFKVRVITRGTASAYQLCRAWQRVIAPIVGAHPAFRLTRGPCKEEHIHSLLAKAVPPSAEFTEAYEMGARSSALDREDYSSGQWRPEPLWISGDYSAATDNLNAALSEVCLSQIAHQVGIPELDQQVLVKCLTRHNLIRDEEEQAKRNGYPPRRPISEEDRKVCQADQLNGQMMGSPASFPILCLVNAAVTRAAMETTMGGKRVLLKDLPILINGDDVLVQAQSRAVYEVWKTFTSAAGLEFSIGKNYISRNYLVVNSEIMKIRPHVDFFGQRAWILDRSIPIINMGHVYPEKKSAAKERSEQSHFGTHVLQRDSLRDRCIDFVEAHPYQRRSQAVSLWISSNLESLMNTLPPGMSYWIHPSLGGLGLPWYPYEDQKKPGGVNITEDQRKLAAYLYTVQTEDTCLINTGRLKMPIPSFVEAYMRNMSATERKLEVRFTWAPRSQKRDSPWIGFSSFYALGFHSDPPNVRGYKETYRRCQEAARKHWARPLSLRKCLRGALPCGDTAVWTLQDKITV